MPGFQSDRRGSAGPAPATEPPALAESMFHSSSRKCRSCRAFPPARVSSVSRLAEKQPAGSNFLASLCLAKEKEPSLAARCFLLVAPEQNPCLESRSLAPVQRAGARPPAA